MSQQHLALRIFAPVAMLVAAAMIPAFVALAQTEDNPYTTQKVLAGAKTYADHCQVCHGEKGDGIGAVNLARQQFKTVVTDDDIRRVLKQGVPAAGMPSFAALRENEVDGLIAFIRSGLDTHAGSEPSGDPLAGKALFFGVAGCSTCHLQHGFGPMAAPDLSNIGTLRLPSYLASLIRDPNSVLLPINKQVIIRTVDGAVIRGRRLNEDTYTMQLVTNDGKLVSISRDHIAALRVAALATMPAYGKKLSDKQIADLTAYLSSLKGVS